MKGKVLGLMGVVMAMAILAGCVGPVQSGSGMSTTVINASPEKVWNYLCNLDWTQISPMIKEETNKQGNVCTIGSSEDQVQSALGKSVKLHLVVTDIIVNQRLELKYDGDAFGTTTYTLLPEGKGTRLTVIMQINGKLPPGVTYDALKGEIQKQNDQTMAKIKANIEK